MATYTKEWVTYDVNSGGIIGTPSQDIINFTAAAYTGRNDRQLSFTITADNPSTDDTFEKTFYVKQTGKPVYLTLNKKGFTITNSTPHILIEGVTNSPIIGIRTETEAAANILGTGIITIVGDPTTPMKEYPISLIKDRNNKIPDDPGATRSYRFTIKVPIPDNPDITKQQIIDYTITVGVLSSDGTTVDTSFDTLVRVFQGYDYILNVNPETLTFNSDGGTQSATITSNTNWTIS